MRHRFARAALQGLAAGAVAGFVLGVWAIRVNGDLHLARAWLALGRVLPEVMRGAAWFGVLSLALEIFGVIAARRGRRQRIAMAGVIVAAGAVVLWLGLTGYQDVLYPYLRNSTPRLSQGIIGATVACWAILVLLRAWNAIAGDEPSRFPRLGPAAAASIAGAMLAVVALHVSYDALGSMRVGGRPSIIIVSLDTLRADRLGFMGNRRGLTPKLDALAGEGIVFERAIAPSPWTLATHASLFTSKLPFDHHARLDFQRVAPQQRMLAEVLRQAGYRTGAFTEDGYVAAAFGFGQGFEIYDESDDRSDNALDRTLPLALDWVRRVKDDPFFLFLHTYEVHSPYTHADRADPALRGRLGDRFTNLEIEEIRAHRLTLTDGEREWVRELYDGDVAYTDRLVGDFLLTLKREGILDRSILVVLSDHGDDLWDHSVIRSPGHGHSLYQELIHVPLFVRWPGAIPMQARIAPLVSLLDVAPTLLDLVALPAEPEFRGRSLARTLRAGSGPDEIIVTAESTEYGPDRFAALKGRYKAIFTPWPNDKNMGVALDVAPLEVFDLLADPAEQHDLSARLAELPQTVVELVAAARSRGVAKRPTPNEAAAETETPSDELLERLRSLGYVK